MPRDGMGEYMFSFSEMGQLTDYYSAVFSDKAIYDGVPGRKVVYDLRSLMNEDIFGTAFWKADPDAQWVFVLDRGYIPTTDQWVDMPEYSTLYIREGADRKAAIKAAEEVLAADHRPHVHMWTEVPGSVDDIERTRAFGLNRSFFLKHYYKWCSWKKRFQAYTKSREPFGSR